MLNPLLNLNALRREYRQDDRVRIENILDPEIAERALECILKEISFRYIYVKDGQYIVRSPEEMRDLDQQQTRALQQQLFSDASRGIGFYYCGYKTGTNPGEDDSEGMRFLKQLCSFLNGPEMLEFLATITGRQDLKSAESQFTRYTPGQYLTRHQDVAQEKQRRLAFVLSFSKGWHPDWGGLLQFYEQNGNTRDAWAPAFNTLSLFDVRHIHAVTFVAPYAAAPRISLTGWFRAAPPKL